MNNVLIHQDISREWISSQKLIHLIHLIFSKRATEILWAYQNFVWIDFQTLWENGKRWIILDVDECIAPHHGDIFDENFRKIEQLKQKGWDIVVFSNMKKTNRYENLEKLWIPVCTSPFAKPDSRWFLEAMKLFTSHLNREQVIMIWDNYVTDGGSIKIGVDFIKVKPIETENEQINASRKIQKIVRSIVDTVAFKRWNLNYK